MPPPNCPWPTTLMTTTSPAAQTPATWQLLAHYHRFYHVTSCANPRHSAAPCPPTSHLVIVTYRNLSPSPGRSPIALLHRLVPMFATSLTLTQRWVLPTVNAQKTKLRYAPIFSSSIALVNNHEGQMPHHCCALSLHLTIRTTPTFNTNAGVVVLLIELNRRLLVLSINLVWNRCYLSRQPLAAHPNYVMIY